MDISVLLNCYCKSREMTHYYSNLLQSEGIGEVEKGLIYDLLLDSMNASAKIRRLCNRQYDYYECKVPFDK